jgi:hypothetical protein
MRKSTKVIKQLGGPSDPRHGTPGGYSYWGCRCEPCRKSATDSVREYRTRAVITNHGRYGYDMGCRCDTCAQAKRESTNERRSQLREWRKTRRRPSTRVNLSTMA